MTGDYIKQLQLKKQIEQKAKEAAKSREAAEEKLVQAENSLKLAKKIDAPSAESEKFLTEASSFFKEKDYRSSVSMSTKSLETSNKAQRDRVSSMIGDADELRNLVEKRGAKAEDLAQISQEARSTLAKGLLEDAFAMSKDLWDKVEKFVNRYMATAFGEAQTVLLLAEGQGIVVDAERKGLAEARDLLEKEQVPSSMEKLASCLESLESALTDKFQTRADSLMDVSRYQPDVTVDLSKVERTVKKAQGQMEQGSYEEAFVTLSSAEGEQQKALTKGFATELQSLRKRGMALKDHGVDIKDLNSTISIQKDLLKDFKFNEALDGTKLVRAALHEKETVLISESLLKLRPKLLIAKRLGIDLGGASKKIEAARAGLSASEIDDAMAQLAAAEEEIGNALKGLADLESELSRTRTAMSRADDLGLDTTTSKSFMDSARRATLSHEFVSAAGLLREAQSELNKQLEEHYAKDVMAIEIKFAGAARIGVDVTDENGMLDKIVDLIKKGEFTVAPELLAKCSETTDSKLRFQVQKALDEGRANLESYKGSMDVSSASAMLDQARKAMDKNEFVDAYDLAAEAAEALNREEKQALETRLGEARSMLDILKELNCESVTLKDKMAKAEEMRAKNSTMQALRTANDVVQFSHSIILDELTREMASTSRAISLERKKGVEVMKPEHLLEEAGRALKEGAFQKAFENLKDAGTSLKQLTSVHVEIYDRIVEISTLLEEADSKGIDTRKATDLLLKTKRMFESGKYGDARAASAASYAETEVIVAPFMAARRIEEAKELVMAMDTLGLDTSSAMSSIQAATELEGKNGHLTALKTMNSGIELIRGQLASGISRELEVCRSLLERTRSAGIDISSPQQILTKAASLLAEKRYLEALRAAQMTRSELDQLMLMEQKANEQIERTMATLKAIQDLGVNVSPAVETLNQARIIQKQGNHPLAMELSKRAVDQAAHLMDMMASRKLDEVDVKMRREELEGPDLVIVDRIRKDINERINQRRFRDVLPLVRNYEDELLKVKEIRDSVQRTIVEVRSRFDEAAASGVYSEELRQLMAKAEEKLKDKAFAEASALALRSRDELTQLREMFEARMAELQSLKHDFQFLDEGDDRTNIGMLLDQTDEALLSMDFERSSLYLHRANAQFQDVARRESGRNHAEMTKLFKLLSEIGYDRSKLSPSVLKLQEIKIGTFGPKNLEMLTVGVRTLRQVTLDEFDRKRRKVSEGIEKARRTGLDVSASEGLYTSATGVLLMQDIGEAFRTLQKSERLIGAATAATEEFKKVRNKLKAELDTLRAADMPVVAAEQILKKADALRNIDTKQGMTLLREAMAKVEEQKELMMPDIGIDIDFMDEPKRGEWAKFRLHVTNNGIAAAREIKLEIVGDVEVKGLTDIDRLPKGEKRTVDVSICPKSSGSIMVKLMLSCKPLVSEEMVGFESELELTVG
ncbi:MAG TPA: CARDB domain-containing protein [Methanomassiliicoccales archaeon]